MKYIGIDQYGQTYRLTTNHPRKELLKQLGATAAQKIYRDQPDGSAQHVGYIIQGLWINLYTVTPFRSGE